MNKLENYKLTIQVKGPVHIGSGEKLSKKEYFIYNNTVYIVDTTKFFELLRKRKMINEYESFMMNKNTINQRFDEWLKNRGLIGDVSNNCILYSMDLNGNKIDKSTDLLAFIKNPFYEPYIPGSTIKGLLRTILLSYEITNNPDRYNNYKEEIKRELMRSNPNKKKLLSKIIRNIEIHAFNTLSCDVKHVDNAVNDIFKGLIISDSEPFPIDNLILVPKIEERINGTTSNLPLLREAVCPGIEISFDITIDKSIFTYSKQEIMDAIRTFSDNYYKYFLSKFGYTIKPKENTIWLGGGVGFNSKTIILSLFKENATEYISKILSVTAQNHGHKNDISNGVSPRINKLTESSNEICEFGKCEVIIE